MHNKTYALVDHGVVLEFPLTEDDINAINIPTNNYLPCYHDEQPTFDSELEYLVQVPIILNDIVIVKYRVIKYTLNEKLARLLVDYPTIEVDENNIPWIDLTKISQTTLLAVIKLVKDTVQKRLDDFAATKGYDDCKSVVAYQFSSEVEWVADAERAIYLRDTSWKNLYTYLANLQTGAIHPPRSFADIEVLLPVLTWN